MISVTTLVEFSCQYCIAICAFLVPANLVATVGTLLLLALARPMGQIRFIGSLACLFALTLFLHVGTWFIIGVITPVTFILSALGSTCIGINLLAIIYSQRFEKFLRMTENYLRHRLV